MRPLDWHYYRYESRCPPPLQALPPRSRDRKVSPPTRFIDSPITPDNDFTCPTYEAAKISSKMYVRDFSFHSATKESLMLTEKFFSVIMSF